MSSSTSCEQLKTTFQVEPWSVVAAEGRDLFKTHYEELALHKDVMPMNLDHATYLRLEALGMLFAVTVRVGVELVGYYVGIVLAEHPHNAGAGKVATTDMFYVSPSHRRGGTGAKLLKMAERVLRDRGVVKATITTKLKFNNRELLEALGWEHTDLVFQKVL